MNWFTIKIASPPKPFSGIATSFLTSKTNKSKVHDNVSGTFDLLVLDVKNDVAIPEKGFGGDTIFEAGTNYTQKFWEMNNVFPLKESEQRFVDSIKN